MPPKLIPIPVRTMTTRMSNKDTHPGLVDLEPAQRTLKIKKAVVSIKEMQEKAAEQARAAEKAANIEDLLRHEDDQFERRVMPTPTKFKVSDKFKALDENQVPGRNGKKLARIHEDDFYVTSDNDEIQVLKRVAKVPGHSEKKLAHRHEDDLFVTDNDEDNSSDSTGSSGSDDSSKSVGTSDVSERVRKRKRKDKKAKAKATKKARQAKKSDKENGESYKKGKERLMNYKKVSHGDIEQLRTTNRMGAEASKKGKTSKTYPELADDAHGIDLEWKNMVRQRGERNTNSTVADDARDIDLEWQNVVSQRGNRNVMTKLMKNVNITDDIENSDGMVKFGGLIPEGETDAVEANAIKNNPVSTRISVKVAKDTYPTVKIENNPIVDQSVIQTRGGDRKWKLCHLGDKEIQNIFTEAIIPRIRKKAGALNPWTYLNVKDLQEIVDDVFGAGAHKVAENGPWMGLTTARLQNWRNGFSQHAMDTVELLLNQNKEELNTKEHIKMQMDAYLDKSPIRPGSEHFYYAYQWLEWDTKEGFMENMLILRTFGLAHLAYFNDDEKFEKEKPVGALILAMQAVGRALELWKTGEKSETKLQPFSADLHDDTYVKTTVNGRTVKKLHRRATIFVSSLQKLSEGRWKTIIERAREHVSKPKKVMKSRARGSSSTTVEDLVEDDPDADFSMELD